MKKLLILLIALLLSGEGWGATISKVDNALGVYHQLVRVGNIVYAAFDSAGVQRIDWSIPKNPTTTANDIAADKGMETYGIAVDGNYVYAATRQTAAYTNPDLSLTFDGGDTDLSNGGDSWTSGYKSASDASITGAAPPFFGDYSCAVTWTANGKVAYTYATIAATGTDYYQTFWLKLNKPTGYSDSSGISVPLSMTDGAIRSALTLAPDDAAGAGHYHMEYQIADAGGTSRTIAYSSNNFVFGAWYQIKVHLKVGGIGTGGGQLWYRSNLGNAFTSVGSSFITYDYSTAPNRAAIGTNFMTAGAGTGGSVCFDEYTVSIDATPEATLWNEGRIDCLLASDLSVQDTIWIEYKASAICKNGNYLFVAAQLGGLYIFDCTDPTNLQFVANYNVGRFETQGIAVSTDGNTAYIANHYMGLTILDVTTKTAPALLAALDFTDSQRSTLWQVVVDGTWVYGTKSLASGTYAGGAEDKRGIVIYDVSNPAAPVQYYTELPATSKDTFTTGDGDPRPMGIVKFGNKIVIANGTVGVSFFDVSSPTSAKWIRDIDITGEASIMSVEMDSSRLWLGDGHHTGGSGDLYLNTLPKSPNALIKLMLMDN